jgi:undecaprenyl phosphate N,N'-diacetylbacillosamine 1-phosphate transferase
MYKDFFKILLDRALALFLILFFAPLFIVIALFVFFDTKKFPIFTQERALALNKKRIKIYKFRTFKENKLSYNYNSQKILSHPELSKFVTKTGKVLRTMGLDELPQLFNVLKGEMSLIGPRPLIIEDLQNIKLYYPELHKEREKIELMPGITGLWQISKDGNFSVECLISKDQEYEKNISLLNDIKILMKTFKIALCMQHKDSLKTEVMGYSMVYLVNLLFNIFLLFIIIHLIN